MEEKLYGEFLAKQGRNVKRWWFNLTAKQILKEMNTEKGAWDRSINVLFQRKVWCDEEVMKRWITDMWGNVLLNPPTPGSIGKVLYADVHTAQTDVIKTM